MDERPATLLATATFTGETASGWQQVELPDAGARSRRTPSTSRRTTRPSAATPATTATSRPAASTTRRCTRCRTASAAATACTRTASGARSRRRPTSRRTTGSTSSSRHQRAAGHHAADGDRPRRPASGATDVSVATAVTATFSEAIDAATVNSSTFELRNAAGPVPANVGYNATTRVATLTPSAPLAPSTTYTATVQGGATDPRVKERPAMRSRRTDLVLHDRGARHHGADGDGGLARGRGDGVARSANITATFSEAMDRGDDQRRAPSSCATRPTRWWPPSVTYNATNRRVDAEPERQPRRVDHLHRDRQGRGERPARQGHGRQCAGHQPDLVVHDTVTLDRRTEPVRCVDAQCQSDRAGPGCRQSGCPPRALRMTLLPEPTSVPSPISKPFMMLLPLPT